MNRFLIVLVITFIFSVTTLTGQKHKQQDSISPPDVVTGATPKKIVIIKKKPVKEQDSTQIKTRKVHQKK
jgi:hypothetical protein